jgi:hypothetical protein
MAIAAGGLAARPARKVSVGKRQGSEPYPSMSLRLAARAGWSGGRCGSIRRIAGTAMRYAAERRNLDESIEELRQIADGRNDVLAEAAGSQQGLGTPAQRLTLAMSWSVPGCSSLPEAAGVCRWTMTS